MKLEEYLQTLPRSVLSGNDVQLPDHSFREIFDFANLSEKDVFYHLGCGDGKGLVIALEEFGVSKAVGIDVDRKKIDEAQKLISKKNLSNGQVICRDIID